MPKKLRVVKPDPIDTSLERHPSSRSRERKSRRKHKRRRRGSFYDLNSRITVWCTQDSKDKFYAWADTNDCQYNEAMDIAISLLLEHGDASLEG